MGAGKGTWEMSVPSSQLSCVPKDIHSFKGVFIQKKKKASLGLNTPDLCMERDPCPDTLCSPLGQGPVSLTEASLGVGLCVPPLRPPQQRFRIPSARACQLFGANPGAAGVLRAHQLGSVGSGSCSVLILVCVCLTTPSYAALMLRLYSNRPCGLGIGSDEGVISSAQHPGRVFPAS